MSFLTRWREWPVVRHYVKKDRRAEQREPVLPWLGTSLAAVSGAVTGVTDLLGKLLPNSNVTALVLSVAIPVAATALCFVVLTHTSSRRSDLVREEIVEYRFPRAARWIAKIFLPVLAVLSCVRIWSVLPNAVTRTTQLSGYVCLPTGAISAGRISVKDISGTLIQERLEIPDSDGSFIVDLRPMGLRPTSIEVEGGPCPNGWSARVEDGRRGAQTCEHDQAADKEVTRWVAQCAQH